MSASLIELLGDLKDPRDPRGVQYPLVSVPALCLVATLAGHTGFAAIAPFGRLRQQRLGHALGFKNGRMPGANMSSQLLRELDADPLDRTIGAWLASRPAGGWDHIALDGKTLRGSRDGDVPGTHLLAAYAPRASAVVAQVRVEATTNEHKTAVRLLGVLPSLKGAVVTADAMFTHRDVCKNVLNRGGDYVLYAKDNQATLQRDIRDAFAAADSGGRPPSQQRSWAEGVQTARVCNKGHGRYERRTLTTTAWLNGYLDWPQVGQVFRLVRERVVEGRTATDVVYGITSLSRGRAAATRLLGLSRAHRGIENGLHYTRDETLGEDRCRARKGRSPRVLASLRNVAIHLLRGIDAPSVAAAIRQLAANPRQSLDLLNDPHSTSE